MQPSTGSVREHPVVTADDDVWTDAPLGTRVRTAREPTDPEAQRLVTQWKSQAPLYCRPAKRFYGATRTRGRREARPAAGRTRGSRRTSSASRDGPDLGDEPPPPRRPLEGRYDFRLWSWRKLRELDSLQRARPADGQLDFEELAA